MLKFVVMLIMLLASVGADPLWAFAPKPKGPVSVTLTVNPVATIDDTVRVLAVDVLAESSLDLASTRVQVQLPPGVEKLNGANQWQGTLLRGQSQRLSFQIQVTDSPTKLQAEMYVSINGKERLAAQDAYTDTSVDIVQVTRQVLSDSIPSLHSAATASGKSESRKIVEYRLD